MLHADSCCSHRHQSRTRARCASRSPKRKSSTSWSRRRRGTRQSPVHAVNPLGKVPVLVLDDGTHALRFARDRRIPRQREPGVAADSRAQRGSGSPCALGSARRRRLRRRARDRARRPSARRAQQSSEWIARQRQKIERGVAEMASELGRQARGATARRYTLADIATGCALGYLDLRHPDLDWRDELPEPRAGSPTSSRSARRSPIPRRRRRRSASIRAGPARTIAGVRRTLRLQRLLQLLQDRRILQRRHVLRDRPRPWRSSAAAGA